MDMTTLAIIEYSWKVAATIIIVFAFRASWKETRRLK